VKSDEKGGFVLRQAKTQEITAIYVITSLLTYVNNIQIRGKKVGKIFKKATMISLTPCHARRYDENELLGRGT